MTWKIYAAGKPALAYAKTGIAEYLKRLSRGPSVELIHVKDGNSEAVSADLLNRSLRQAVVVLGRVGRDLTDGHD